MPWVGVGMKYKNIMAIFGVSALISFYLRLREQMLCIDARGFVRDGYAEKNFFLLLWSAGFLIAAAVVASLVRRCPLKAPKVGVSLCAVSAVLGVWMIYESVTVVSPASVPAWQGAAMNVLGVLSGLMFLAYAASGLVKFTLPGALFILPVLFWMLRLIWVFTALNTLALTVEHVFLLMACSALLVFMLQLAKLMSGQGNSYHFKWMLVSGVCAVIFCADYALPNLLLELAGSRTASKESVSSEIMILLTAAFVLVFLIAYFDQRNLKRHHRHHSGRAVVSHPGSSPDGFYLGGTR